MAPTLVGNQIENGQRLLDELRAHQLEVRAACWATRDKDTPWYFYIATPLVDQKGLQGAYLDVHPIIRQMPAPYGIDPFDVRLVGASDPLVTDIQDLSRGDTLRIPRRFFGPRLGKMDVYEAVIYPSS